MRFRDWVVGGEFQAKDLPYLKAGHTEAAEDARDGMPPQTFSNAISLSSSDMAICMNLQNARDAYAKKAQELGEPFSKDTLRKWIRENSVKLKSPYLDAGVKKRIAEENVQWLIMLVGRDRTMRKGPFKLETR